MVNTFIKIFFQNIFFGKYIYQRTLRVEGTTFFSHINLKSGIYQVKIRESDRIKTDFTVLNQTYALNRIPFGLVNAPYTFQRKMSDIIGHLDYTKVCIDDILVHSKDIKSHISHLTNALKILESYNVKINFQKTSFLNSQVKYLGHVISSEGIRSDISRVSKFKIT